MKNNEKYSEKDKINIRNLNKCIKEYKKLGSLLNILVLIVIVAVAIYVINKLHIMTFVFSFLKLLIPLFLGLVIAWFLSPLVDKLNTKIPKIISCTIIYVILIGLVVLVLYLVIPNLISQVKDLFESMPIIINELKEITEKYLGDSSTRDNVFKAVETVVNNYTSTIPDKVIVGTRTFIKVVTNFALGIMISFYLSYDYHKITRGIYKLIPDKYRNDSRDLISRINHSLRSYVKGLLIVMFFVFLSQSIGLSLAGLKAPLIFALFCAITDIIPYFGPWIGAIPAVIVGFVISPLTGIFTIVSIVVVQALENNFYQPLIMGHTMKLHPVTIMLGLLIFGHFFGIIGMVLATPLVATIKIILVFVDEKMHIIKSINSLITNNE